MWRGLPTPVMPTSLGIVQMQIHCLGPGSVAEKPHTSRCPAVSVADITDWATSPALQILFTTPCISAVNNYNFVWSVLYNQHYYYSKKIFVPRLQESYSTAMKKYNLTLFYPLAAAWKLLRLVEVSLSPSPRNPYALGHVIILSVVQ